MKRSSHSTNHLLKRKVIFFLLISIVPFIQSNAMNPIIYLIPGQGADYRLFNNLDLGSDYEIRHIHYETPQKGTSLPAFAKQLSKQIDTTEQFILIGVSLGGMIATEMHEFLSPQKTIIISSAKTRKELPFQYRFQRKLPLYKILSSRAAKVGAQIMQPIVEPDRNKEKTTFKSMLKDKDPAFFRRTIEMILKWERVHYAEDIIHIHGNKDRTIPIKNVSYNYLVPKGSHMMTLTRGEEISQLLLKQIL